MNHGDTKARSRWRGGFRGRASVPLWFLVLPG